MARDMDLMIQAAIEMRKSYLESCREVVEHCPDIVKIVQDGKAERARYYRELDWQDKPIRKGPKHA